MPNRQRASGVLLHITSLPSAFGIGDLGPESYRFADLIATHKQRYWSILPLSPTRLADGNSPYQTSSAFAGNPLLISPELLIEDGLLPQQSPKRLATPSDAVDFNLIYPVKDALIKIAYASFEKNDLIQSEFEEFCDQNKTWLDDYALYVALRQKTGKPWYEWLPSLRHREPKTLGKKTATVCPRNRTNQIRTIPLLSTMALPQRALPKKGHQNNRRHTLLHSTRQRGRLGAP